MAKYVFDSNIFIFLQRNQPIDIFPALWNKLGELLEGGVIISSQEVLDEISVGGDELKEWAKARKNFFLASDVNVQEEVRSILSKHRALVECGKKSNSADPFVIALAKMHKCKMVTGETRTRNLASPKIPDVCDDYGIECVDFVTFLRDEKLHF